MKSIVGIQVCCLDDECGRNVEVGASTLEKHLADEPTLANLGQIASKFKCQSCGSANYSVFDNTGQTMLFNSNQMKFCESKGCGAAIPIPRWAEDPNVKVCVECKLAGETTSIEDSSIPKVPIGKQTCPRCGSKSFKKTPTAIYQNRKDGDYFLGCSSFPACRWSESL